MKKQNKSRRAGDRVSSSAHSAEPVLKTTLKNAALQNKILAALPAKEFDRLMPKLKLVELKLNDILHVAGKRIEYVYFISSGIVSLLTMLEGGATVEAGIIGSEGIVGVSVIMGVEEATNEALVQASGYGLKMPAEDLQAKFNKDGMLRSLLMRYIHSLLSMMSQNAACNRIHTLDERLARWLLLTHDRVDQNEFVFTQEFMSHMLGVRRAGVSVAANTLRQAGLIDYQRGFITVLNRPGLEDASCECYRTIEAQSDGFHRN